MRAVLAAAAALLATACAQPPGAPPSRPAPPPPTVGATCDAAPAQFAVGRPLSDALVQEVQQRSGARIARVLRPGQVVTMEYNAGRVNLQVDAAGRVTAVRCG